MGRRRRHWQLEALRGLAVVMMIHFHFVWDLLFFGLSDVDLQSPGWILWTRSWQTVFVGLVGVSIAFAGERRPPGARERAWRRRGLQLLALAAGISVVTRIFLGDAFILFGILHLVGATTLLAPFLWKIRRASPFVGLGIVGLSFLLRDVFVESYWLVPLGISPQYYPAVDYFPFIPWLGVVMLGIGVGRLLQRRLREPGQPPQLVRPLTFLGRHSLLIYVVHQPILLAGFMLFGYTIW